MKSHCNLALFALFLGLPTTAFALRFEAFGNAAILDHGDIPQGVAGVVNLPSRVYCQTGDGPQNFYFRGHARALDEALGRFATIRDESRQLILLPGPVATHSFDGKRVEFDWQLTLSRGRYRALFKRDDAVLRVYVNLQKPRPLDAKNVEKWLGDLDSETFATRAKAMEELAKVGNDAKPFLRDALKGQSTLEKRRRIDSLLDRLPRGYDVTDFEIPPGLALVTIDDLLAENLKKMHDPDIYLCGGALEELAPLAPYSDKVVPAIMSMLDKGKNEWVRRVAALNLADIGFTALSALPILKEGLDDPDMNIRKVFQTAIEKLDKATERPAEETRRKLAIADDIRELKKATLTNPDEG